MNSSQSTKFNYWIQFLGFINFIYFWNWEFRLIQLKTGIKLRHPSINLRHQFIQQSILKFKLNSIRHWISFSFLIDLRMRLSWRDWLDGLRINWLDSLHSSIEALKSKPIQTPFSTGLVDCCLISEINFRLLVNSALVWFHSKFDEIKAQ